MVPQVKLADIISLIQTYISLALFYPSPKTALTFGPKNHGHLLESECSLGSNVNTTFLLYRAHPDSGNCEKDE